MKLKKIITAPEIDLNDIEVIIEEIQKPKYEVEVYHIYESKLNSMP